jgi:CBS domain-containing protein
MKGRLMNARDVMTTAVVSVAPDIPVSKIAKLLLEKGISAVPVVDGDGLPLGMVSEGDLMGRDDTERAARRDWWLQLLAEGDALHPDFLASMHAPGKRARDIMSAPLVTVGEDTSTGDIARLLTAHQVKRVPVVRDGRIVGVVSRANLLGALISEEESLVPQHDHGFLSGALASLDDQFLHRRNPADMHEPPPPADRSDEAVPLVADFQGLVSDFKRHECEQREALRQTAAERRRQEVKELIDQHISDEKWRTLLHEAREAAHRGEKQLMLMRFPCELCSDGGRAINVPESGWASTLRGAAAEMYLRWERDLKPHGFHLSACVLDFPDWMPGDIGLFLVWGSQE